MILMERYHFFASNCRQFGYHCQSLSQLRSVVSELEGTENGQREVLKGCKLVFSHAFPSKIPAHIHYLWKVVEQLGATCSIELDPSVTHVVSTDARTEKSRWAAKEAKFLVDPRWIETANFLWQKQPEENFPVQQTKPEENFHAKQMKDQ